MDIMEAIEKRHSVRAYKDDRIPDELVSELNEEIKACNLESGLNIQLITEEPNAFKSIMAKYGKFRNVKNYIALIGKKEDGLDEKIGYYGERIVLKAQQLGLNTCWVGLTYSKRKSTSIINKGEKLVCVISLGFGETQGTPHKSKELSKLCKTNEEMPDWFLQGMKAAMLAPTAINQQKFLLTLSEDKVKAESTGGPYSKVDLGIVKYHFEAAAGKNFQWE